MSTTVTLKWSKQTFPLQVKSGESASSLKQRIQAMTGVPIARQKVLAKKAWKGPLSDSIVLTDKIVASLPSTITLIGSADTLKGPSQKTTFVEDMTAQELQEVENAQMQQSILNATGMIAACQLPPHLRDDGKQETYSYNRLVTGLPQRQIEQLLLEQQGQAASASTMLRGKVAMTLGLELRRAYVNDLAVLSDGTCVSANDDGHVQLWKHGAQQYDVVHPGDAQSGGGVDSVVAIPAPPVDVQQQVNAPAFATAGRGFLQLWTAEAEPVGPPISAPVPGTSFDSLVTLSGNLLAARFRITRPPSSPAQFHLPPQNESERQRRALARAQEQAIQQALARAACSIQILWFGDRGNWQTRILEPPMDESAAPITCLAALSSSTFGSEMTSNENPPIDMILAGDASGGLRLWQLQNSTSTRALEVTERSFHQLTVSASRQSCSIVSLQVLRGGGIGVATTGIPNNSQILPGATSISLPMARAVHILDLSEGNVKATLNGHANDSVICMCELPDGALVTGGGKMDATLQLWKRERLEGNQEDSERIAIQEQSDLTLSDVGYVFALASMPDSKEGSSLYALAAARYNTVKIIL